MSISLQFYFLHADLDWHIFKHPSYELHPGGDNGDLYGHHVHSEDPHQPEVQRPTENTHTNRDHSGELLHQTGLYYVSIISTKYGLNVSFVGK